MAQIWQHNYTQNKIADLILMAHSPWPTLRLLILNTSRTHSQSQQTQKRIVQQITKITLVTDEYLKSIQVESYSNTFINHKLLSNLSTLKNSLEKLCQKDS